MQKPNLLIEIEHGRIFDVSSDQPDVFGEIIVADYDTDGGETASIAQVPVGDGTIREGYLTHMTCSRSQHPIDRVLEMERAEAAAREHGWTREFVGNGTSLFHWLDEHSNVRETDPEADDWIQLCTRQGIPIPPAPRPAPAADGDDSSPIAYLNSLLLAEALWWFIENATDDAPWRTEAFFALRERFRAAQQTRIQEASAPAAVEREYAFDVKLLERRPREGDEREEARERLSKVVDAVALSDSDGVTFGEASAEGELDLIEIDGEAA